MAASLALASVASIFTVGSLSAMVTRAVRRLATIRYEGDADSVRITVSAASPTASSIGVTVIVTLAWPSGIVTSPPIMA